MTDPHYLNMYMFIAMIVLVFLYIGFEITHSVIDDDDDEIFSEPYIKLPKRRKTI